MKVVTLLIVSLLVGLSYESRQLCVVGNEYKTDPLNNCTDSFPISHFAQNSRKYSMPDTVITFFGMRHTLNGTWEWTDVSNVTFKAQKKSRVLIKCLSRINGSGFKFLNVSLMRMLGLSIVGCGIHWTINSTLPDVIPPNVISALFIAHGSHVKLTNINIRDSEVSGLYIYNVSGEITIDSCVIKNATSNRLETLSGNVIAYDDNRNFDTSLTIKNSNISDCGFDYETKICSANAYSSGLALIVGNEKLNLIISNTNLYNNKGCKGGNMVLLLFSFPRNNSGPMIMINDTTFENGSSFVSGGGVYISFEKTFLTPTTNRYNFIHALGDRLSCGFIISNSHFNNNFAQKYGGGIVVQWMELHDYGWILDNQIINSSFDGNSIGINGSGGLGLHYNMYIASLNLKHRVSNFRVNLDMKGCSFSNHNPNISEEELRSESSVILAKSVPYLHITDLHIISNNCTAILAIGTNLIFSGSSTISGNRAISGAGIRLCSEALMYINSYTDLIITDNTAEKTGGGILVNSKCLVNVPMCFYQFNKEIADDERLLDTINITVSGNDAARAGLNIYGGSIDYCYLLYIKRSNGKYKYRLNVPKNTEDNPSSMSSNPQHVCFRGQEIRCGKHEFRQIYPGEKVTCEVQVVGQVNGAVPGTVLAIADERITIKEIDEVKTIKDILNSNLTYTIYSSTSEIPTENTSLSLKVDLASDTSTHEYLHRYLPAVIHIRFKSCPFGFTIKDTEDESYKCQCVNSSLITKCSIENQSITKLSVSWVGKFEIEGVAYLALAHYCPLDYCDLDWHGELLVDSNDINQDEQCRYNRTGILCGSCPDGWSSILGSSDCYEHCSNLWLLLIVPLAIMGLLLVIIIHFLNLTVTMGTVCGLIFYANIMQDYSILLFGNSSIPVLSPTLRVFIAWLNLDLGIPTCFYSEMGALGKTLFQLVFPLYIWLISAVIIALSNRYIFITRIVGQNAIKVLATLILLSYPKLLRVTIGSLNLKYIDIYANDTHKGYSLRWILDGNIAYIDLKMHLILIMIGIIFVIFTLPFALSLLCIRHVYSLSNYCRLFSWINNLKPFFDTYTGPYKDRARFWTGLLLVVRLLLLMVHTVDYTDYQLPFIITIIVLVILLAMMVTMNGVYKKHYLNILECSFLTNMCIVFIIEVSTLRTYSRWKVIVINLLVSVTFFTFLGIISFHLYMKCSSKCEWIRKAYRRRDDFDVRSCEGMRGYENLEESASDDYMEASDKMIHFPPLDIPSYSAYERSRSFQAATNVY